MQNLWNDQEAAQFSTDLALRVYTSRLLGREPALVLHGGGNTSVKIHEKNLIGETEHLLYVKGSGWDLITIEEKGFAPVRMNHLLKLAQLPALSDAQMVNEMRMHMTNITAPTPSVETIMHAVLPYKYVDHTHADAVVTITNTPEGYDRIKEIYGDDLVIIPYVMPGFDLSRVIAEEFPKHAHAKTQGIILMNHGIFSFGETARESYDRMIELVTRAEDYLKSKNAWELSLTKASTKRNFKKQDFAQLRKNIADTAGFPVILKQIDNAHADTFLQQKDLNVISQQGPATPDHVIRTKQLPMLGRDVAAFRASYETYFAKHAPMAKEKRTMLDPAPRMVLDSEFGFCTIGKTAKDANIVADIYEHTIEIILRAQALSRYQALPSADIFNVEYWDLEQAKLRSGGKSPVFTGEIVLITGGASGIGKMCVESFLARGAHVIALDINPAITSLFKRADFLGLACDVTDDAAIRSAIDQGVKHFGGLDMLVLNAGIFPKSCKIADLNKDDWRRVMSINMDSNVVLMQECHSLLKLAPRGGRVVIIGSKNVPAPGPGAAAYSASKAAMNQLMRVAALEWGSERIRINTIHPNAVFDTNIWTPEVLQSRAASYGLSVDEYKKNNVLKVEVTSHDVAELAAEMCGPLFAKTTGAQVQVDGGNERVI